MTKVNRRPQFILGIEYYLNTRSLDSNNTVVLICHVLTGRSGYSDSDMVKVSHTTHSSYCTQVGSSISQVHASTHSKKINNRLEGAYLFLSGSGSPTSLRQA